MKKSYKFTQHWFFGDDIEKFLPKTNDKISMLEIGPFEGKSTIWFLNNILTHPKSKITCIDPWTKYSENSNSFESYSLNDTELDYSSSKQIFLNNIYKSGSFNKVVVHQGLSYEILPKLSVDGEKYDIIFIDGNHTTPFVLTDCVMSWYLLKAGGIMIFDDYLWRDTNSLSSPKIGIDSFLTCFGDYLEVIWSDYKLAIKKNFLK